MPVDKYSEDIYIPADIKVAKKKAPKKNSAEFFFARTKRGLQMRGIKNEHELKYILRFQASGITGDGSTGDGSRGNHEWPKNHAESYREDQEAMMENLSEYDYEGRQFHQERIDALWKVIAYFDDIGETIFSLDNPHYTRYDDRDETSRMFGDH
jgi:hypothetical protein